MTTGGFVVGREDGTKEGTVTSDWWSVGCIIDLSSLFLLSGPIRTNVGLFEGKTVGLCDGIK